MCSQYIQSATFKSFPLLKNSISHQNAWDVIVILTIIPVVKMHVESASKCVLRDSGTI